MSRQQKYLLLFFTVLFSITIGVDFFYKQSANITNYGKEITHYLQTQETKVKGIFADQALLNALLQEEIPKEDLDENFKLRNQLAKAPFTIFASKNDSLLFWSNNLAAFKLDSIRFTTGLIQLHNGFYYCLKDQYRATKLGNVDLTALIPIKANYSIKSDYLKDRFSAGQYIPTNINPTKQVTENVIQNASGSPAFYLEFEGQLKNRRYLGGIFCLYLISFILLAVLLNSQAKRIAEAGRPWLGALFLMVTVFGLRYISILIDFTGKFEDISIFSKNLFNTSLSNSLGDLLINIFLLLWMMIFFHQRFPIRSFQHLSKPVRFSLTTLNYFSILIGILMIVNVFKSLVIGTEIVFDFDYVFNLNVSSLIAIIGVIILLIALFIFSHRMMLTIVKIGFNRNERLAALGIASLLAFPVLWMSNLLLPPIYLILIAFVFILIFDLFVDNRHMSFTWLAIWMVILSAFPSILLFKYNAYKERLNRFSYAKTLAELQDSIAVVGFQDLQTSIRADKFIREEIRNTPHDFAPSMDSIDERIKNIYTGNDYLFYNYTYKVHLNNLRNPSITEAQRNEMKSLQQRLTDAKPTKLDGLYFWTDNQKAFSYFLKLPFAESEDNHNRVYLEFQREKREQSKVYTELLVDQPYKNLKNIANYDYAIYKKFQRLDGQGQTYGPYLNEDIKIAPGERKEIIEKPWTELTYRSDLDTDIIVVIGRDTETFIKAISLFSYIFGILIITVVLFSILNTFYPFLPNAFNFSFSKSPSLKGKIQWSVISSILVSFFIIGFVTIFFFKNQTENYHYKRLARKTTSVLTNTNFEIQNMSMEAYLKDSTILLEELVKPLSQIHRLDINLYDLRGRLIHSSEEDIIDKGILMPQMDAIAFYKLSREKVPEYIQEKESVGELAYKSSYIPINIKMKDGKDKTIAYMGMPYYSKQRDLRNNISAFMSTLMNVYVFLLLIAGGIAIVVANSITRPIGVIGEKLKQFKLGKRNEPLEWKNKDELGALISEYNNMIRKLEESAKMLAQSEREGAWREMAKQVAHEIKNPLTPMKLSIQYLQHAYRANPDNIEPLLKKVSVTLIEQIDNLAAIASEFSNFAKMPRAENQQFVINTLVSSVYDLFSEGDERSELKLYLPEESYQVFADKNHLMRVFNNLIKNALQAIPDGRKGLVEIHLYRKDQLAIIKVSDNGTGIPLDKQEKVFVPNFTTKNSGTGLGLAISKNIIEAVDGSIYFQTEPNVGTDFFVEMPIVEVVAYEEV